MLLSYFTYLLHCKMTIIPLEIVKYYRYFITQLKIYITILMILYTQQ